MTIKRILSVVVIVFALFLLNTSTSYAVFDPELGEHAYPTSSNTPQPTKTTVDIKQTTADSTPPPIALYLGSIVMLIVILTVSTLLVRNRKKKSSKS